jgi:hypothetical protein
MGWVEDNTNEDPMAKVGMRIRMLSMNDEEHPVDQGLEGTITHIDGLGTIHVRWDDGRALGVIPGLDEYQILPPEGEQVGPDDFEGLFGESLKGDMKKFSKAEKKFSKHVTKTGKDITKTLNKANKSLSEKENIKGGEAENMTPSDLAKKHGVKLKDIEKEIEVGVKIEMEHTDSKEKAKEIAMDHIAEFPDFYTNKKYGTIASEKGLEKVNEDESTYTIKDDVERILKTIKTAKPQHKETILKMISNLEKKYQKKYGEKEKFVELIGTLREKVGKKFDIDETTTTGALGSSPVQPLGTDINRGKLSKTVSSDVVTKGNLKNPTGTVYTIKPKTESRIIKVSDLLSEVADTDAIKLRDGGSYDGDSWVGDKGGWKRRKELAWKGGKISDILAKLDINWTDSDLSLTDKETDKINNINEGWLKKTKEDKLALEILERVKEEYPQDTEMRSFSYGSGNYIEFTLEGLRGNVKVRLESSYSYGDLRDSYGLWVNNRRLLASRWAIKKLYKYISKEFTKRKEAEDLKNIETDLISPDYAEDVFDALGDSDQMNEVKKDKDIHTAKWDRCFEKVSKEKGDEAAAGICTDSIGYEDSIKKSHRKKDKEEIEETTTFASVWGVNGPPVTPAFAAKKGKHGPSKKPIWKGGKIVQKIESDDILVKENFGDWQMSIRDKCKAKCQKKDLDFMSERLCEVECLTDEGYFNFSEDDYLEVSKGVSDLFNEENKIKWVKGGKFVKIKDKCTKFNNQPWCDSGNASDPLELSDTTFENVKRVSEKTGISEQEIMERINIFKSKDKKELEALKSKLRSILMNFQDGTFKKDDKIALKMYSDVKKQIKDLEQSKDETHTLSFKDRLKIKLAGIDEDQVLYNLNNGLPIDWRGSKEGYYEKIEPKANNRGSN